MRKFAPSLILISVLSFGLAGCASMPFGKKAEKVKKEKDAKWEEPEEAKGIPLGNLFGKKKDNSDAASLGVNSFLWRATLDTLSFMPLASADPYGGTILTDWHSSDNAPDERFKIQVFILDTRLRADGIAVRVFKQVRDGSGWHDVQADPDTQLQIENAILTRARQLRISTLGAE